MKKISILFFIFLNILCVNSLLSITLSRYKSADSLFLLGKKELAFSIYEQELSKNEPLNNNVLLKASLISEETEKTAFQLLYLAKLKIQLMNLFN